MAASRQVPLWTKIGVGFHLLAITVWSLPDPPPGIRNGMIAPGPADAILLHNHLWLKRSPIQQYIQTLGLYQAWDMFAPDPTNRNVWGDAIVTFRDGTEKTWVYPRMATMPLYNRYPKERYRKFYERANLEAYNYWWPVFGQRVAFEMATDRENPPVRILLRRQIKITPSCLTASEYFSGFNTREGKEKWFPSNPDMSGPFEAQPYFTWVVDQDQLAQQKGWR